MEKIKRLLELLKDVEFVYIFKRQTLEKLPVFMKMIEGHINWLELGRQPIFEYDKDMVRECVAAVVNTTIERRMTPLFKEFYEIFSFLVFNWNENVMKDDDIRRFAQYIDKYASDKLSMNEVQSSLIETAHALRRQLVPGISAFKASVHYWDLIKKEDEKCPSVGQA